MNIFKKISDVSTNLIETIRQDITPEAYHMSKTEFYDQHFPKHYDNTVTYVVQYRGIDETTSWGPFSTIESAQEWSNKINSVYQLDCDIIYIRSPRSNPNTWLI